MTGIPKWQRNMADETFADVKNLLRSIAWNATRSYHCEFQEAYAVACLAYVKAYLSYPNRPANVKMAFSSWVANQAIWLIREFVRNEAKRIKPADLDFDQIESDYVAPFDVDQFVGDAKTVVKLVIDSPNEIMTAVKPTKPRTYRSAIRRYLRAQGWTNARITKAYQAIAQQLAAT